MEVVIFASIFLAVAALVVAMFVRSFLRTETVGALTVPVRRSILMKSAVIRVLREPLARDEAAVFIGCSRTLAGPAGQAYQIAGRDALQFASWLEMGCERSGDLGTLGFFRVSSAFEDDGFMVELTQLGGGRQADIHALLAPRQAKLVAQWLRIAAAPGRTLAEARRRLPKASA